MQTSLLEEPKAIARTGGGVKHALDDAVKNAGRLVEDSLAPNTRRAYQAALRRYDGWRGNRAESDGVLAEYLGFLDGEGLAPPSAGMAVAAVRFRARILGVPCPVGPATEQALRGYRRGGRSSRGRGPAKGLSWKEVQTVARECGNPVGRALLLVMFQACLRRSEAAALDWSDVEPCTDGWTQIIRVRGGKTRQEGQVETRLITGPAVDALENIRPMVEGGSVFGLSADGIGRKIRKILGRRGIHSSSHGLRRGYAEEMTVRGATTHEIMQAGGWKTARMVAHYAKGVSVTKGATAKYL